MDSLRQLSMKFLEREELANYNFQNEFMKPFAIVMHKSSAVEIRELIIRCVSQMVLSCVKNIKSGWKGMFMTVNCLIAFTNSRFNRDISLNAIEFLRFCAEKLAEGDLGSSRSKEKDTSGKMSQSSPQKGREKELGNGESTHHVDQLYFWVPLLAGLSELSFDPRPEIRKSALQVLFDNLRNYGQHFSLPLWEKVFESVLFRIFDDARRAIDPSGDKSLGHRNNGGMEELDQDSWVYETCTLALQLVVDLFVNFYDTVNPLLKKVLILLVTFIKHPRQSLAGIGIAAFVRLMNNAGDLFSDDKWLEVVLSLKEAAEETLPDFSFIVNEDGEVRIQDEDLSRKSTDESARTITHVDDSANLRRHHFHAAISDVKCRAAVQLLLIQAVMEIYNMYRAQLSVKNTILLVDAVHAVAYHAHKINRDAVLHSKLPEIGPMTQLQDPPLLHLENESCQICLTFLQNILLDRPPSYEKSEVESYLVNLCQEVLKSYVETACSRQSSDSLDTRSRWTIPLGSGR
ncbi:Brefeldin A-inhibited guanine nucleotide-exchange protein 2 [Forsythia ovata]|uniref:Brefeldin A-inhibited guanine nucleotide-exchange protein 2 n=1 Tax=Forsythia ovata TaxID=205694 RepID=A0ABD1VGL5_9LAMI